jgi:hypothetical protein
MDDVQLEDLVYRDPKLKKALEEREKQIAAEQQLRESAAGETLTRTPRVRYTYPRNTNR